ncbi:MAG: response regulator [Proteobacteria bacterium]|nr:response regulator [Pseudomonadota bacterium]
MPSILIVDDDSRLAELISQHLESFGYRTQFLLEAEFLFQMLGKKSVDLILMDISMPVIDGLSLLKQLKTHSVHRTIPVIMLTEDKDDVRLEECIEAGAIDYIGKPVGKAGLRVRLQLAFDMLINSVESGKPTNPVSS